MALRITPPLPAEQVKMIYTERGFVHIIGSEDQVLFLEKLLYGEVLQKVGFSGGAIVAVLESPDRAY